MSTSFNKSESLRDLLRCILDGAVDGEAARVAFDVIDELDCLPPVVETPNEAGRLVWYGEADNSWLGRMGAGEREEAYFTHYLTEVCYYPSGDVYAGDKRQVEVIQGSAGMYEWATELGFTVDPCPFIKETPVVEPVGSDLDQLFAAFLAWRRSSRGKQHRLANLVLYDDGSGRLSTAGEQYLMEWCDHKEGAVSINSLIDNS